ncbi:stathmin domain-containing protein 1 isoform X2 [Manis javanica]|uniref:stathmin domain-containing protein 1 isoform X2 n=1 Tax=Manis javanica TaxID=9974 RepID=UPI003C6D5856
MHTHAQPLRLLKCVSHENDSRNHFAAIITLNVWSPFPPGGLGVHDRPSGSPRYSAAWGSPSALLAASAASAGSTPASASHDRLLLGPHRVRSTNVGNSRGRPGSGGGGASRGDRGGTRDRSAFRATPARQWAPRSSRGGCGSPPRRLRSPRFQEQKSRRRARVPGARDAVYCGNGSRQLPRLTLVRLIPGGPAALRWKLSCPGTL